MRALTFDGTAPRLDPRHADPEPAPGEAMVRQFPVKTYYFDRLGLGITEFRAILDGVPNSNPHLAQVWAGRSLSNAYGIRIDRARTYAASRTGALEIERMP